MGCIVWLSIMMYVKVQEEEIPLQKVKSKNDSSVIIIFVPI